MFEFVRTHTRILQFVLVLLIFPSFVFFGIQGYSRFTGGENAKVAKVDGRGITQAEWNDAHRRQVERIRAQSPTIDSKLLDAPAMKARTLESLVREHVLLTAVERLHLPVTDERLQRMFVSDPQYAALRNADGSLNAAFLAARGMSPEQFVYSLRQDLSMRQVLAGLGNSAIGHAVPAAAAFDAMFQAREVQVQRFQPADYAARIKPTDAEIEAFYRDPANAAALRAPEQATIEYAVLDLESIRKGITVPEEELRKYYQENIARYSTPEERRASHILIKADKDSSSADKAKAKTRAETLLAELRKNPKLFADLARKNSQDPGSASRGGDLDYFGRGAMVKSFEDAAFGLKPGEISGVVESDFGFHIIELTGARGGDKKSFDSVRAEVLSEVSRQIALRRYAEAAEQFSNLVYEQGDSLKPAADKLKLEIRSATLQRGVVPQGAGALAHAKFLDAIFAGDAVTKKHNTEAIEVGTNQMISGRVVRHEPEHMRALDEVRGLVRERVAQAAAAAQARRDGEARLAELKAGKATGLPAAMTVSRVQSHDLSPKVLEAILKLAPDQVPGAVGVDLGSAGYVAVRVLKVVGRDPAVADAVQAQGQYAQLWANAETQAYLAALHQRYKAEILVKPNLAEAEPTASAPAR